MDIIGYVFLAVAAISLITGISKGFANSLFGLITAIGSIAVAILLTPTISNLDFVKNLLEDTPIIIAGTEMFFLRTVVVFCVLFVLALVVFLSIKGLFRAILARVQLLKVVDKLLGVAFNVAIVWAVFGIVFAISNAGTDWLVAIDEQLASSGVELGLAQLAGDAFSNINSSEILNIVYATFNPAGELIVGLLLA